MTLKSPFPWPGGKSDVAAEIWRRFGNVPNYVESHAGSAAVLFLRPDQPQTETLNDLDGFICNALRSIAYAPEETAVWCDWPVSEADLTAAHLWLKAQRDELTSRLMADPDYCDPKAAGRWLWGVASWIGDGWCVADGPWINLDGRLVDRRTLPEDGATGIPRKLPGISPQHGDTGIQKHREGTWKVTPRLTAEQGIQTHRGVPRKMPEVGRSPNGQIGFNRKGIQAIRHEGVRKKMPKMLPGPFGTPGGRDGIHQHRDVPDALFSYFTRLSDRLRRVRLLCGDWKRVVKDSVTVNHGLTALFMDPPYPQDEHGVAYHGDGSIWYDVARWAAERGDDPRLRICVAGYYSESTDLLFPASWPRHRWEARGGYSNQSKDGRGRANAKRECLWFSPTCLDPEVEARAAFEQPIIAAESDWTGTLFDL